MNDFENDLCPEIIYPTVCFTIIAERDTKMKELVFVDGVGYCFAKRDAEKGQPLRCEYAWIEDNNDWA